MQSYYKALLQGGHHEQRNGGDAGASRLAIKSLKQHPILVFPRLGNLPLKTKMVHGALYLSYMVSKVPAILRPLFILLMGNGKVLIHFSILHTFKLYI